MNAFGDISQEEWIRGFLAAVLLICACAAHAGPREDALAVVQKWADAFTASEGLDKVTGTKDGKTYSADGRVTFVLEKRGAESPIVHFHRSAIPG